MFVSWNKKVFDRFRKTFDIKVFPLINIANYDSFSCSVSLYVGEELNMSYGYDYSEDEGTICERVPNKICIIHKTVNVVMQIPDELFYILEEPLHAVPVRFPDTSTFIYKAI